MIFKGGFTDEPNKANILELCQVNIMNSLIKYYTLQNPMRHALI